MVLCKWDIDALCEFGWSNMVDRTYVGMFLKPSTFGAKWVKTYASHSAIICEALWPWQQGLTISLILMGKPFGVVLPIHIHIMDPIYVELPLGHHGYSIGKRGSTSSHDVSWNSWSWFEYPYSPMVLSSLAIWASWEADTRDANIIYWYSFSNLAFWSNTNWCNLSLMRHFFTRSSMNWTFD